MMLCNRSFRVAAALAAGLGLASIASAGPPLICHPIVMDAGTPLLPWAEGRSWHLPDLRYDVAGLVDDTLELLSSGAPILARMENMRRATIYAQADPKVASALLHALLERTETTPLDSRAAALEWFDAGYLIETYRQMGVVYEYGMLPGKERFVTLVPADLAQLDGYVLVQKALELAPEAEAEFEYASSLMTRQPLTNEKQNHATAAASPVR